MTRRELLWVPVAAAAVASGEPHAELPNRQIRLDFLNNESTPDVDADFDEREFVRTLTDARVRSISVVAKCENGFAYYGTSIGARHPSLKIDLFGAMVRGCSAADIRVNYCYSLAWDLHQSRLHPEWLAVGKDGARASGSWPWLCLNSPYLDQVIRENREIAAKYPVNGAFFDHLRMPETGCYCQWCVADRRKQGLGDDAQGILAHIGIVASRVEQALLRVVREPAGAAATVSYGGRRASQIRGELENFAYLETAAQFASGSQHEAHYLRTLGKDCVGMTGTNSLATLEYECLATVANGMTAGIRDFWYFRGRLDQASYKRIGSLFKTLQSLEPWTQGCRPVADIGVLATQNSQSSAADEGCSKMLVELHQQWNVIDLESDFELYKLIVLPDEIRPAPRLVSRLEEYVKRGGALLVTGSTLIDNGRFASQVLGVGGPSAFIAGQMALKREPFGELAAMPRITQAGLTMKAEPGTEVLATWGNPAIFARVQAPDPPLITKKGRVVLVASPLFRSYLIPGREILKQVIGELIRMLMPRPSVVAPNLPSTAQVTMLEQRTQGNLRRIVHILHYTGIGVNTKPALLENVELSVSLPQHPLGVVLVPSEKPLEFKHNEFYTTFTVPRVHGHQAIAFE